MNKGMETINKKNNYYELFYFFNRSNHGKIKIQTDKNLKNYLDIDSFLKSLSDILDKNILEHIVDIKEINLKNIIKGDKYENNIL